MSFIRDRFNALTRKGYATSLRDRINGHCEDADRKRREEELLYASTRAARPSYRKLRQ